MAQMEDWEFPEIENDWIKTEYPTGDYAHIAIQFLYADPDLKFAFCPIEKNACSAFDQAMTRMLARNASIVLPKETYEDYKLIYNVGYHSQHMFGRPGIEKVFADPGATRAVFVRDPLHRFL